jgi:EAL domain-containing protein (putative c-di-GMP-specific phosphodiesterase class I)
VLREACRQAREWQKKDPNGAPVEMCVNLSAKQLQHSDLLRDVDRILRETGMDGSLLCLEITESVAMENVQTNVATLNELKDGGIKLSIDDFGTGYSSLSYLNRLPVHYLKIDRSFVAGLGEDPEAEAIILGTIRLAHDLRIKVIAEGVETAAQLGRLREMGCDMAQGYYFSKPLTATEISGHFSDTVRRRYSVT